MHYLAGPRPHGSVGLYREYLDVMAFVICREDAFSRGIDADMAALPLASRLLPKGRKGARNTVYGIGLDGFHRVAGGTGDFRQGIEVGLVGRKGEKDRVRLVGDPDGFGKGSGILIQLGAINTSFGARNRRAKIDPT